MFRRIPRLAKTIPIAGTSRAFGSYPRRSLPTLSLEGKTAIGTLSSEGLIPVTGGAGKS
jgi:hypothetical protein